MNGLRRQAGRKWFYPVSADTSKKTNHGQNSP